LEPLYQGTGLRVGGSAWPQGSIERLVKSLETQPMSRSAATEAG